MRALPLHSSTGRRRAGGGVAAYLSLALLVAPCADARAQGLPLDSDPSGDPPLLSIASPVGPIEYFAGRGLRFGDTGLSIGGFSTLEIDREEGEGFTIELDSISFLVRYQPIDELRVFAEIEVGDLLDIDVRGDDVDSDPDAEIERLYADLGRSDAVNLRMGKFQTPIGRWNLVPAEPFVWTAADPVLTERAFDEHQTGAALFGTAYPGSRPLKYWLYGQFVDPLDPDVDPDPADRGVGGRLEYGSALDGWSLGTSFLASERKGEWSYLGGLDAEGHLGPLGLTSEFVFEQGDIPGRDLWGVYLQGVYDLRSLHAALGGLYAVGRYEHFHPSGSGEQAANLWDLGLTWIPRPYLNIKVGYRLSDRETEDVRRGLNASISVLF